MMPLPLFCLRFVHVDSSNLQVLPAHLSPLAAGGILLVAVVGLAAGGLLGEPSR